MPFSLLCCCCYPFCVSLSSCFGIFSSDCIPPSLQLPQHLPSTVFIHKGPVSHIFLLQAVLLFFLCVCVRTVSSASFVILQNFTVFLDTDTQESQVSAQAVILQ